MRGYPTSFKVSMSSMQIMIWLGQVIQIDAGVKQTIIFHSPWICHEYFNYLNFVYNNFETSNWHILVVLNIRDNANNLQY